MLKHQGKQIHLVGNRGQKDIISFSHTDQSGIVHHIGLQTNKTYFVGGMDEAGHVIEDWDAYRQHLKELMGYESKLTRQLRDAARQEPQRVVFAEGIHPTMLKAAVEAKAEGICQPRLQGWRFSCGGKIVTNGAFPSDAHGNDGRNATVYS